MRFKLYFNEEHGALEISALKDNQQDIILPVKMDQHVHYPIPGEMVKKIKPYLAKLIDENDTKMFIEFDKQMKELTDRRRDAMNAIRERINPKIIEVCKEFKSDNAELFI